MRAGTVGERVTVEGAAATPAQVKKKKFWEKVVAELKMNDAKEACWSGKRLVTSAGACSAPTLAGAPIS